MIEGRFKTAYERYRERAAVIDAEARANGGKLQAEQLWRRQYYEYPYMLLESDDTIMKRVCDLFTNCLDLSEDGMIVPTPLMENDARLARNWIEVIEETNWRLIFTKGSFEPASKQLESYFVNGVPFGVALLKNHSLKSTGCLYKFSKREFVREMVDRGRFRISPASYYAKGSHIKAVKDLETERDYRLKAIREILEGTSSIEIEGQIIPIVNGVVPICFMVDNYYLFSSCNAPSRRMPTDFEADAVLIIKNKKEFIDRMRNELLISYPGWEFLERDVYYYDSYNDNPKDKNQELYKDIAYAYQKEHRCVLRRKIASAPNGNLEPFFVELGPLNDIAEAVYS